MTTTVTPAVKAILDKYEATSPAVKANLARILMQGKLGGTGKLARRVQVFHAQQPGTFAAFGIQKAGHCSNQRTKVQRAGGGGGETAFDHEKKRLAYGLNTKDYC